VSELVEVINNKVRLHLHAGQTKAWDSDRRFTFIYAGTQGGKTSFEPWWLRREIANRGDGDYLAVTATYDLLKLKFLPEMQNVFCDLFHWEYSKSERVIWKARKPKLFDRIILRSAESEGGLESSTAKAAILDECGLEGFSLRAWEAIQRRLSLNEGRVLGGTTLYNLGWTKSEVYDRWRAGDKDYMVVQFASVINPKFPNQEYERAKATLPEWKFNMMYMGEFSRPPGLIYGDLTDQHYINPIYIPPEWPRYVGIDPGPNNTAAVWIAEDPLTKCYYLYREYLDGDKTTHEHATKVKELSVGENIFNWALGQKSEKQYRLDWQAEGLPVHEPEFPEVDPGIDKVIALIKEKRFYIFNTLAGCKDQFGTYSRKVDDNGQTTDEIKDKEKYHYLDAIRYDVISFSNNWLMM
jgi:hypothetical protein